MVAIARQLNPAVAPRRQPAPKPNLRVVAPTRRGANLRLFGVTLFFVVFVALFSMAALHAVRVQTQAEIDSQRVENLAAAAELELAVAQLAWIDSPEGLEQWANERGLVEAPQVISLAPLLEGALGAPTSTDPFVPNSPALDQVEVEVEGSGAAQG